MKQGKGFKVTAIGVLAVAGGFGLAACGTGGTAAPAAPAPSTGVDEAALRSPAGSGGSGAEKSGGQQKVARCGTADLSVRIGDVSELGGNQVSVKLVLTNKSATTCELHGVPGVDLRGPADPNGPVYSLTRVDDGDRTGPVAPGETATANIVVLAYTEGSEGSFGSKDWVPTQLVTTPPGETTPFTLAWPAGLSVLRQDSATHPGSAVHGLTAKS